MIEGAGRGGARPPLPALHDLRPFAFRKAPATTAADFLSTITALFIAIIARKVSSALTLFRVDVNAVPFSATSFLLRTGATYWKPNMFRGSCNTT